MKKNTLFLLINFASAILHAQIWSPLGPIGSDQYSLKNSAWGGGTGQITAFAFAPQADHKGKYDWYCTSPFGGFWKSIDEGHNWVDLNPQLELVAGICSGFDVAVDPHDPATIYVANGTLDKSGRPEAPGIPSTGVFRSSDGGKTFHATGLKFNYEDNNHITRLVANPWSKEGNIQLFAVTDKGLFMSQSDVSKKWTRVLDEEKLFTAELSPNYPQTHTVYTSGDDIYVSRKEGSKNSFYSIEPSVSAILPPLKTKRNIKISVADRNGTDVIYAMVYQDGETYFLYYDSKWEMRKPPIVEGVYIPATDRLQIDVNPANPDNVFVGVTYVSMTDDGGKSWKLAGRYCQPGTQTDPLNIHGDIHAVRFIPGTNDILIGTDGGIFRYLADEKKELYLNTGLNISHIVGMSAPPLAPHKIMIGKQDTGFDIFDGHQWTNFFGGDGFSIHASPTDTTSYLCNLGFRFISKDKMTYMERAASCKANESALFSNVAYDPKFPDRCFMGGTNISYTDDGAKTFTTLYKFHTAAGQPVDFDTQIENIAVGHDEITGESVVYASCYGFYTGNTCKMIRGRFQNIKSSGKPCEENLCSTCWTKLTLPHDKYEWLENTSYSVSGIAVSPADPDELWICYDHNHDKRDLKVFHSTDGGTSWSDMDKGLPEYTICTTIRYDDKTRFLYLGTPTGVYLNKNDGSGWKPFGQGLPRSYVKVLEIQPGIGKIRAGLYGRGVWEADLAGN